MKRSLQWDIVGCLAVGIGVASWICLMAGRGLIIGSVPVAFGNPFIVAFGVLFGLACFAFGFLEARKTADQPPGK